MRQSRISQLILKLWTDVILRKITWNEQCVHVELKLKKLRDQPL